MTSGKGARRVGLLAALLVLAAATEASAQAAKKSWFERIDANGDGAVEPGELAVVVDRQFGRLDVNGDGSLSPDEMPKPAGNAAAPAAQAAPPGAPPRPQAGLHPPPTAGRRPASRGSTRTTTVGSPARSSGRRGKASSAASTRTRTAS
jgi:hypothetical protein